MFVGAWWEMSDKVQWLEMPAEYQARSSEDISREIKALQHAIRQLSELMGLLKGTPSIVQRLKDKAQPARRDKRQPYRGSKTYLPGGESKIYSSRTKRYEVVEGPCDRGAKRPWDETFQLEGRLGIR